MRGVSCEQSVNAKTLLINFHSFYKNQQIKKMCKILKFCLILSFAASINAIVCNFTYQEEVENYPSELIETLVSSSAESEDYDSRSHESYARKEFFCDDDEYDLSEESDSSESAGGGRLNYVSEEDGCEGKESYIFPKTLPNLLNKMMTVVNGPSLQQQVRIEECVNLHHVCDEREIPLGTSYICRQRYLTQTLRAFDEIHQVIFNEVFFLPSSCECKKVRRKNLI
jgi:hypothetical protein